MVIEYITKRISIPLKDFSSNTDLQMTAIRSFEVSKPGAEVDEHKGDVTSQAGRRVDADSALPGTFYFEKFPFHCSPHSPPALSSRDEELLSVSRR